MEKELHIHHSCLQALALLHGIIFITGQRPCVQGHQNLLLGPVRHQVDAIEVEAMSTGILHALNLSWLLMHTLGLPISGEVLRLRRWQQLLQLKLFRSEHLKTQLQGTNLILIASQLLQYLFSVCTWKWQRC